MSAGYELTQLRPGDGEYGTIPSNVKPILEFIFAEGFPHSIQEVGASKVPWQPSIVFVDQTYPLYE